MKVRIRRIDKSLPLPVYKTAGAVAFDLSARTDVEILPRNVGYVPLNVAIAIPAGYMIMTSPRSSLHKQGVTMVNGIGVFDEDFCGNEDEYHAALFNFTDKPVVIERGMRLVQGMLKKYEKVDWEEVDDLGNHSRGGFGTTGIV